MNKQQTAVECLVKELNQKIDFIPMNKWDKIKDIVQQAKEMEKQQIIDACNYGDERGKVITYSTAEQYYNKTYGSKGSNNKFDVEKEMFQLELPKHKGSIETKPHSFCMTPEKKCTINYCDENGCINRKRNLVKEPSPPKDRELPIFLRWLLKH